MVGNLREMLEDAVVVYFKVLTTHLFQGAEENSGTHLYKNNFYYTSTLKDAESSPETSILLPFRHVTTPR